MKNKLAAALGSVVVATLAGTVLASEVEAPKPITDSATVTVQATVVAIDHTNRIVLLKGPEGNLVELEVDPSVTRFNALKVGDMVTTKYHESTTYELQKPGTAAKPDSVTTQTGKYTGAKPGGGIVDTKVSTVTIVSIDANAPAVTVRTSDGEVKTVPVKDKARLSLVKPGDQVVVTKTKGLMISAEAAK